MDSIKPLEKVVEIRCQDKYGNVIDDFRLDDPIGQDQIEIEGSKLLVAENYSKTIVLDVVPRGDKYEKNRIEFQLKDIKEDAFTVVLEPVQYKVVFRIGNTDFEATETMNPATAKSKWGTYDYAINNTNKTIYIRVYGKPVMKMTHEPIHTVVERPSIFKSIGKRFPGKSKWLLLLLALLLGYGIYACISKFVSDKTPWPFKAKTEEQIETQLDVLIPEVQSETQTEAQVTPPQEEATPSYVAPTTEKVVDSNHQHDVDYLKQEKKWNVDSLRTPEYKTLFDALKEGDVDQVIQLKDALFDSTNIQADFRKVVDGLTKFKNADDQKKLKMSKDEMMRLCKRGSFEIGELSYSISLIDKRD